MNRIPLRDEFLQHFGIIGDVYWLKQLEKKYGFTWEQLKKQILDDYENVTEWKKLGGVGTWKTVDYDELKELKEKAEKWDKYNKSYWALKEKHPKLRDDYSKLEQENKELKEKAEKWDSLSDPMSETYHYIWMHLSEHAQNIIKDKEKLEQENKQLKEAINEHVDNLNFISTENEKNKEIVQKVRKRIKSNEKIASEHEDIDWAQQSTLGEMDKETRILKEFLGEKK